MSFKYIFKVNLFYIVLTSFHNYFSYCQEPFESISIPVILNPVLFQLNEKEDDFISLNFLFPRQNIYEENTTFFEENFKNVLDKVACAKKNQIEVVKVERQPAEVTVKINKPMKGPKPHIVYSRIREFINTDYNFLLYLFAPSNAFKLYNWLGLIHSGCSKNVTQHEIVDYKNTTVSKSHSSDRKKREESSVQKNKTSTELLRKRSNTTEENTIHDTHVRFQKNPEQQVFSGLLNSTSTRQNETLLEKKFYDLSKRNALLNKEVEERFFPRTKTQAFVTTENVNSTLYRTTGNRKKGLPIISETEPISQMDEKVKENIPFSKVRATGVLQNERSTNKDRLSSNVSLSPHITTSSVDKNDETKVVYRTVNALAPVPGGSEGVEEEQIGIIFFSDFVDTNDLAESSEQRNYTDSEQIELFFFDENGNGTNELLESDLSTSDNIKVFAKNGSLEDKPSFPHITNSTLRIQYIPLEMANNGSMVVVNDASNVFTENVFDTFSDSDTENSNKDALNQLYNVNYGLKKAITAWMASNFKQGLNYKRNNYTGLLYDYCSNNCSKKRIRNAQSRKQDTSFKDTLSNFVDPTENLAIPDRTSSANTPIQPTVSPSSNTQQKLDSGENTTTIQLSPVPNGKKNDSKTSDENQQSGNDNSGDDEDALGPTVETNTETENTSTTTSSPQEMSTTSTTPQPTSTSTSTQSTTTTTTSPTSTFSAPPPTTKPLENFVFDNLFLKNIIPSLDFTQIPQMLLSFLSGPVSSRISIYNSNSSSTDSLDVIKNMTQNVLNVFNKTLEPFLSSPNNENVHSPADDSQNLNDFFVVSEDPILKKKFSDFFNVFKPFSFKNFMDIFS
ncbi:uncharacterized protein LOC128882646 [Hylaeus volcanicus]|uniref:uncharacterized protein LOC128882646 n=1 Tax=Hylaeus volcanicus TaxID=313075 RepID=UPI0023B811DC|nr:uncharacterized protein LOC128882646 [Hylaeus volcanicus]XP_053990302.1 uncharacterized protein LOC128882646 [Hylaeus volcanicus]XP_053990303.1 uncharacterized protein LOC128882646 [Hylaeus volcanicus]XP_053990304.1 uncharacterized protein LOC128882646 [Hylaeus volcanicus]